MIFTLHVKLLFLFLVRLARHDSHLLGELLEVKSASIFVKLAFSSLNVLDLLHVDGLVLG